MCSHSGPRRRSTSSSFPAESPSRGMKGWGAAGHPLSEPVPSPASACPRPGTRLGGLSVARPCREGLGIGRTAAEARGAEGRRPRGAGGPGGGGGRAVPARGLPLALPPRPPPPLPRASGGGHRMFFRAGSPHHPSPAPPLSLSLRSPPPLPPPAPCLTLSRAPRRPAAPGGPTLPAYPRGARGLPGQGRARAERWAPVLGVPWLVGGEGMERAPRARRRHAPGPLQFSAAEGARGRNPHSREPRSPAGAARRA